MPVIMVTFLLVLIPLLETTTKPMGEPLMPQFTLGVTYILFKVVYHRHLKFTFFVIV